MIRPAAQEHYVGWGQIPDGLGKERITSAKSRQPGIKSDLVYLRIAQPARSRGRGALVHFFLPLRR